MVGELRARQIVHLHRLFRVIAHEFEEDGMPESTLDAYRETETTPNDFKATKTEHETALMALSDAVAEWAAQEIDYDPKARRTAPQIEP